MLCTHLLRTHQLIKIVNEIFIVPDANRFSLNFSKDDIKTFQCYCTILYYESN